MMRQASSRNHRSKGYKVKNVLQLCLLAAVCLWLLYQLKHSYDKKRALEEGNLKTWDKLDESQPELLKFGRKDLPHMEEDISGNETHDKEDNEEVEEEEQDQETRGDGDGEIDEQDQERADEQEDQERADEESENEEELTNEEDKDGQGDETELLDDQDPEEDSSHRAREESYRRDDVSSAVHRENQSKNSEDEDGDAGGEVVENREEKDVDTDDMADGADDGSKGNGDSSVGGLDVSKDNVTGVSLAGNETNQNESNDHSTMNEAVIEKQGSEVGLSSSEGSLTSNQIEPHANSTAASRTNNLIEVQAGLTTAVISNQTETHANSTVIDAVADSVPFQNETVGWDSVQNQNITIEMETSKEDKVNLRHVVTEGQVERFHTTGQEDGEHSSVFLGTNDNGDAIQGESTDSSHKMVMEEERDARIDLSTLPDMQNEVKSMADEAAE